ncbi:MAG: hypothetical protein GC136_02665 [Alphaproteobacteria bacterium]|nr:hypothetical protein [Alphaproteobacteria bacterium]
MTNTIIASVKAARGTITTRGYEPRVGLDCGASADGNNYSRRIGIVDYALMPGNLSYTTVDRRADLWASTTDTNEEMFAKLLSLADELGADNINIHYMQDDLNGYETARLMGALLAAAQSYKNGQTNPFLLAREVEEFECQMDIEHVGATALAAARRFQAEREERHIRAWGGPNEGHYLNQPISDEEVQKEVKDKRASQQSLQEAWRMGLAMSHEIGKAMVTDEATVRPLIKQMIEFMEARPPVAAGPQQHANTRQFG